jgi:hypothetical protein
MTFYKEGDNPQPGTPNADVHAFTFGVRLATGKVTPCTAQGQKAEFIFGDTVEAIENGFAVPLLSKTHSGGIGVPCLAGGVVAQGADIIVGMVEFTDNDGVTADLPVAIAATDGEDGDWIVGKCSLGSSASEADTDVNAPSLAIEFYDNPMPVVGGAQAPSVITLHVDLATAAATGDILTDWTPGFAGEIVSIAFAVTEDATTAGGDITINPEINATNVTGGVLTLTTATVNLDAVIAASAVTAANVFDANDTITFEAVVTGAFTEGEGDILITVKSTVGA